MEILTNLCIMQQNLHTAEREKMDFLSSMRRARDYVRDKYRLWQYIQYLERIIKNYGSVIDYCREYIEFAKEIVDSDDFKLMMETTEIPDNEYMKKYYANYAQKHSLQFDCMPENDYIAEYEHKYMRARFYGVFDGPYFADPRLRKRRGYNLRSIEEECHIHYIREFLLNYIAPRGPLCDPGCKGGELRRNCACMKSMINFKFKNVSYDDIFQKIDCTTNVADFIEITYDSMEVIRANVSAKH